MVCIAIISHPDAEMISALKATKIRIFKILDS